MRKPSLWERMLIASALIVGATLVAVPALSQVGSSVDRPPESTEPVERSADPSPEPSSSSEPSPEPSSEPAAPAAPPEPEKVSEPSAPDPEQSETQGNSRLAPVEDTVDRLLDGLDMVPATHGKGCLVDVSGLGPINICI